MMCLKNVLKILCILNLLSRVNSLGDIVRDIYIPMNISHNESILFYFAYGSNMLEKRLRLDIPDATFYSPGLLKHHRLDFTTEVAWWNGAIATICKDPGESVWGIIWALHKSDKKKLDTQEGVYLGWYHVEDVIVMTPDGKEMTAVTYVQNHVPRKFAPWETPPPERQPSATYLRVLILGAVQGGLPIEYVRYLYTIPHNGKRASQTVINQLGSPFTDPPKKIDIKVYI